MPLTSTDTTTTIYELHCDNCGAMFMGLDIWDEPDNLIEEAQHIGWTERDGKWFCEECGEK